MKKNSTLAELWIGSVVTGVLFQATLIWFFSDKIGFSMGLWVGILGAGFMAWHMARCARKITEGTQDAADRTMRFGVLVRYAVAAGLMLTAVYIPRMDAVAVFFGLISLKMAAYLQPVTHKVICHFRGQEQE